MYERRVVCLGKTGINFGAGMSGGIAYIYDPEGTFHAHCNTGMVELEHVSSGAEAVELKGMRLRDFNLWLALLCSTTSECVPVRHRLPRAARG